MVHVTVTTPVRPTEVEARVVQAASRFFPDAVAESAGGQVTAVAHQLDRLRRRIWEQRIIDTFRGQLLRGLADDAASTTFRLSKQAAHEGMLSFPATPHGLGDLEVTLAVEPGDGWADAEALAWWLCPETRDGEVVAPAL